MADDLANALAEARAAQGTVLYRLQQLEERQRDLATLIEAHKRERAAALERIGEQLHAYEIWRARVEPEIATVADTKKGIIDRALSSLLLLVGGAGVAGLVSELVKAMKGGP